MPTLLPPEGNTILLHFHNIAYIWFSILESPEGFTQVGGITLAPSVRHDCLQYTSFLIQVVVVLLLLSREFSQKLVACWCVFWLLVCGCSLCVFLGCALPFLLARESNILQPCYSIIAAFHSLLLYYCFLSPLAHHTPIL
jgi:hypothetical protein